MAGARELALLWSVSLLAAVDSGIANQTQRVFVRFMAGCADQSSRSGGNGKMQSGRSQQAVLAGSTLPPVAFGICTAVAT